jgi:C4-dicarboxylate-specific signal transduction histidine kinase
MRQIAEVHGRLEAALAAGDLEAARAAGRELAAQCLELAASGGALAHEGRLADLGLRSAATVHELRQPLAGIKAVAQLIASGAANPTSVVEKATAIERYAEMMEALCDRLRSYARAEPVRRVAGDVNAAVTAALDLLKQSLRESPLVVEHDLAAGLPLVTLDLVGLQQVLVNLLRNSRDAAAAPAGHVWIATRVAGDAVEVEVRDDGPGVPAEIRPHLFEPFATSKAGGSGLGLWLSRRLAEEVGGSLEYVEGPAGAAFRLTLPRAPGASPTT